MAIGNDAKIQLIIMAQNQMGGAFTSAGTMIQGLESKAVATTGILGGLGAKLAGFAVAAGAMLGGLGMKLNMSMEQTQMAFETMLGSTEKAAAFVGQLKTMAAETPFEFPGLADASRKLLAFGFAVERIPTMLTAVGDAASGLGLGEAGMQRVILALGQMKAKAKVSGDEMLQLTEAGIPAWDILAKAMGKSTSEAMKLSEKGLLPANMAIDALVKGMAEKFPNMMKKQSGTGGGIFSTLMDNAKRLLSAGVTPLTEGFKILGAQANNLLTPAVELFEKRMEQLKPLFREVWNLVGNLWINLGNLFRSFWAVAGGSSEAGSKAKGFAEAMRRALTVVKEVNQELLKLKPTFESIGEFLGRVANIVKDLGTIGFIGLKDSIQIVTDVLKGDFSKAWEDTKKLFTDIKPYLDDIGKQFEGLSPKAQVALAAVTSIGAIKLGKLTIQFAGVAIKGVGSLTARILEALGFGGVVTLGKKLIVKLPGVEVAGEGATKGIGARLLEGLGLAGIAKWVQGMVPNISAGIKLFGETLWGLLTGKMGVKAFIAEMGSLLGATGMGAAVGTGLRAVGSLIFRLIGGWPGLIITGVLLAIDVIKNWDKIKDYISKLFNEVSKNISQKWDEIKTNIGTYVEGIAKGISHKWENIKTSIATYVEEVRTNLSEKVKSWKDGFVTWMTETFDAIVNWFTGLPDRLIDQIGYVAGWLREAIPMYWTAFRDWLVQTVKDIKDWFVNLPSRIQENITTFATELSKSISTNWTAFKDWLKQTVKDIQDWFTNLPSNLEKKISKAATDVAGFVKKYWTAFGDWVRSTRETLTNWLSGLPDEFETWLSQIPEKIGSLAKKFAEKGADLGGKFIDGFMSKLGELGKWVMDGIEGVKRYGEQLGQKFNESYQRGRNDAQQKFNVKIDKFAKGGIVTGPTLGLMGEAGEPEMNLPLSKAKEMGFVDNDGISLSAARELASNGKGGNTTIVVNVQGNIARSERELGEIVARVLMDRLKLQKQFSL